MLLEEIGKRTSIECVRVRQLTSTAANSLAFDRTFRGKGHELGGLFILKKKKKKKKRNGNKPKKRRRARNGVRASTEARSPPWPQRSIAALPILLTDNEKNRRVNAALACLVAAMSET